MSADSSAAPTRHGSEGSLRQGSLALAQLREHGIGRLRAIGRTIRRSAAVDARGRARRDRVSRWRFAWRSYENRHRPARRPSREIRTTAARCTRGPMTPSSRQRSRRLRPSPRTVPPNPRPRACPCRDRATPGWGGRDEQRHRKSVRVPLHLRVVRLRTPVQDQVAEFVGGVEPGPGRRARSTVVRDRQVSKPAGEGTDLTRGRRHLRHGDPGRLDPSSRFATGRRPCRLPA
jgi:hypothetical protein